MVSCSVRGCKRDSRRIPRNKGLKFYSFPKNPELQFQWEKFCDSHKQINLKTARVCSRHFEKKYYFKRPIDIALGLSCPVFFRNLSEDAVPTLNGPPKEGEQSERTEDENSIASIDNPEVYPEGTDSSAEPPRYIFSGEVAARLLESAAETSADFTGAKKTEPLDLPPPAKKLRKTRPKSPSPKKVSGEAPFMSFFSDYSTLKEKIGNCDEIIAQNDAVVEPNDSSSANSQYIILKRSVWRATEDRLQKHFKKSLEKNDTEENYNKVLEENEQLKERLAKITQGNGGGLHAMKARIADLEDENSLLKNENSALRRDKEKLEERTKKHAVQLKQFFTTGQLKRMFSEDPSRHFRWSAEDIAEALVLKSQSIKAYKFVHNKFGFLLPDLSTLRRWVRTKRKIIEERLSSNPTEPVTDEDRAVENLILLYDQTEDGDENIESNISVEVDESLTNVELEGQVIEFTIIDGQQFDELQVTEQNDEQFDELQVTEVTEQT